MGGPAWLPFSTALGKRATRNSSSSLGGYWACSASSLRQITLDLEETGGGRWKKEAQFSPQAPSGQTGRGMVRYWSSVPGRVSSWMGSHGFRALRRAKKAKEGKEGSLEEADPPSPELSC